MVEGMSSAAEELSISSIGRAFTRARFVVTFSAVAFLRGSERKQVMISIPLAGSARRYSEVVDRDRSRGLDEADYVST